MLDGIADSDAEGKQEDLSNCVERDSKDDVAKGPAVIERSEHENELQDGVCGHAKDRPN